MEKPLPCGTFTCRTKNLWIRPTVEKNNDILSMKIKKNLDLINLTYETVSDYLAIAS